MTRTIWLASYPKSGNTWMRILTANLSVSHDQPVDINDLPSGGASARFAFDYIVLIDSGLLAHDEIDNLRPRAYATVARDRFEEGSRRLDAPPARFVKVHDAYTMNAAGEPLLAGAQGAHGAIVIVRDPRDIAPSLANHSNISIDEAIAWMNDDNMAYCKATNRLHTQLRQKLHGWSAHVASWLDQRDIPIHLVRYEDLHNDTAGVLRRILAFVGFSAPDEALSRAVAFSAFDRLQQKERQSGFVEAPRSNGIKFFRRGEVGSWRNELTPRQVASIESHHERMMLRLGYELSCVSKLARAG